MIDASLGPFGFGQLGSTKPLEDPLWAILLTMFFFTVSKVAFSNSNMLLFYERCRGLIPPDCRSESMMLWSKTWHFRDCRGSVYASCSVMIGFHASHVSLHQILEEQAAEIFHVTCGHEDSWYLDLKLSSRQNCEDSYLAWTGEIKGWSWLGGRGLRLLLIVSLGRWTDQKETFPTKTLAETVIEASLAIWKIINDRDPQDSALCA